MQGCKCFVCCSVFIVGKQQRCAVGALAICTDLVAQEVKTLQKAPLPWELPGVVPSPPVFLTANLSQVTITAPRQRPNGAYYVLWCLQNPWFLPWLIVK